MTTRYDGDQSAVGSQVDGLEQAIEAARGRLPDESLAPASGVVGRAADRLTLSGEHTIVALAGATGSGKSSLFNRIADLEIAGVGLRRPTTTWALACAWGPDGAAGLLDWMGIPPRHQVSRQGMLERSTPETALEGLILLDLPDHDSTEVEHHLEMERLVPYADVLVWVLDPQKYADAAIHDRYIRPMAAYADVTLVVLNQIDRIAPDERERALADVQRLIVEAGLPKVPVLGTSAKTGEGIEDFKRELSRRIRAKESARDRLATDVIQSAQGLSAIAGTNKVPGIAQADLAALETGMLDSVGVPQVASAVAASTRRRAARTTGWIPLRWLGRLRKDPMAQLGIGDEAGADASGPVPHAPVENTVRTFAEKAAVGLEGPWRDAVRRAPAADVAERLDAAVREADLGADRGAWWWALANVVQWLSLLALIGGVVWGALVAFGVEGVPTVREVAGLDLPWWVAIGGLAVGLVAALLARIAVGAGARGRARRAEATLKAVVDEITHSLVARPVRDELARYETYRAGLSAAVGRSGLSAALR